MNSRIRIAVAASVAAVLLAAGSAQADDASCQQISRSNVVRCALAASLTARSEQLRLESFDGRRQTASVLLPSNPALSLVGAYTVDQSLQAADRQFLWSATVSQEIEVAGQRGARLDLVSAETRGQRARLTAAQRETAASALIAYFDALAAQEELKIADRLAALAVALKTVAHARAQAGVASPLEAQLAESAAARLLTAQIGAQQRVATTGAALAAIVGLDPSVTRPRVDGELAPLPVSHASGRAVVEGAISRRAELVVAAAEKEAYGRRVALYERLRIPNPTLSVFVRSDWIAERSAGVAIGLPIPLPSPVGRTYAGEIAEANSLAHRADAETARLQRAVRLEVATALETVSARRRQAELYRPEQVRMTEDALRSIAEELEAQRLPVRDALLTQQGLIDYLYASIEARRTLCQASVVLAQAAALPIEAGAP